MKKGKVLPEDVPAPTVSKGSVLIKVVNSCISTGTELTSLRSTGTGLIKQALKQPEALKKVVDFARTQGISKTLERVRGVLEAGKPAGYSLAGVVIGVGEGVADFSVGDRVAAAGAGVANHAEFVDVPKNLVVNMPPELDFVKASTVALGGIALQGVRRTDLQMGEFCTVVGTGILGLLAIQMLRVSGIRVIAVDLDQERLKLAKEVGAEVVVNPADADPVAEVLSVTGGFGSDAVLFTASTSRSEPLSQSFQMCKKKGRVVLVGVSGMEIKREDMYEKELDFLISTSYGPGRYDRRFEEKGLDYPFGYVRWTENRNMGEYLRLLATGQVSVEQLIHKVYTIKDVERAFKELETGKVKPIVSVLDYGPWRQDSGLAAFPSRTIVIKQRATDTDKIGVGLVGAGSFATSVHLPNLLRLKKYYALRGIMSRTGHKAKHIAQRFGAEYATTDFQEILHDEKVDLVFITSRHDLHADQTLAALESGKHVFVEKPLATNQEELARIVTFFENREGKESPLMFVGFNRRFSPYVREIKRHTDRRKDPLFVHYRMNAGYLPPDHWVHEAGGRIVGEACHIVDLMTFLTSSTVQDINVESLSPTTEKFAPADNKSIRLKYQDGSICTIEYFAVGSPSFPKEYMEVHFDGKTIVLDDFRLLRFYGINAREIKSSASRKGHFEELAVLAQAIEKREWPLPLSDMLQATSVTLSVANQ